MACLFGHKWNGCKCTKCGKTRDELHDWKKDTCKNCGKKIPTLFVFFARGQGTGHTVDGVTFNVLGSTSEYVWKEQLQKVYSTDLYLNKIESDKWEHPLVELLEQGQKIKFRVFYEPIKNYLSKRNYSTQEIENAILIMKSLGLAEGNYANGIWHLGVPVGLNLLGNEHIEATSNKDKM